MRYRLSLAAAVLAFATSACGEAGNPTAPAAVAKPAANSLTLGDSTVTVDSAPPRVAGDETTSQTTGGTAVVEERSPGMIGSGN